MAERRNDDPPITFVVTGFGPFRNVPENPTTVIAEKLKAHLAHDEDRNSLESSPDKPKLAALSTSTTTIILETAADAVRADLDDLFGTLSENCKGKVPRDSAIVILHTGVNYEGTCYQIERCGYNDATFRFPDERGFQPREQRVIPDETVPFGRRIDTGLDVESLCREIEGVGFVDGEESIGVVVSTDPGRFVCNYTYCYSLNKCISVNETLAQQEGDDSSQKDDANSFNTKGRSGGKPFVYSLFLHVPPFTVEPIERQLDFVARFMHAIYQQVRRRIWADEATI